ncbi:MAG: MFS transporter [Bacteroidales bacterium]|nr:MFS transporter [Bacteroidales bacterium]
MIPQIKSDLIHQEENQTEPSLKERRIPGDSLTARRNFRLGVINGILFLGSESLVDPTLVMVAFVSTLTQSPLLLGLIVPLRDGLWALPQFWISGVLQSWPQKIQWYRRVAVFRVIAWGLIALTINLIKDPDIVLYVFFGVYIFSALLNGLGGLPFMEVVSKTIPSNQLGSFFAWRMGAGGLAGIGFSLIVRWLLDPNGPLEYPYNFGALNVLFFIGATISLYIFSQIKEPVEIEVPPKVSFGNQFKRAIERIGSDHQYKAFLKLITMNVFSIAAIPFFAIYVQQDLGGPKEMIGIYLAVLAATKLLANIYFGRTSHRVGYRRIVLIGTISGLVMSLIVLVLSLFAVECHINGFVASYILIPAYIAAGICLTGNGVGEHSLMLEIAPENNRSLYLGFTNTLWGLLFLMTGLSGVLVDLFNFQFLFLTTVLMNIISLYFVVRINRA